MKIKHIINDLEVRRQKASVEFSPHITKYNYEHNCVNEQKSNLINKLLAIVNGIKNTQYSRGWFTDFGATICTNSDNFHDIIYKDLMWDEIDNLFEEYDVTAN